MFKVVSFLLCACSSPSFSSSRFLPTPLGDTNCKNNHRTTLNTTLYTTLPEADLHNPPAQPLHNPRLVQHKVYLKKKKKTVVKEMKWDLRGFGAMSLEF
jgi:hypothetical protein